MKRNPHTLRIAALLTVLFLAILNGCARRAEPVHPDAPVVYDLTTRARLADVVLPWSRLDIGAIESQPFLREGWGEPKQDAARNYYAWVSSRKAGLEFICYESRPLVLKVIAYPYARSWLNQVMAVSVNGTDIGKHMMTRGRRNFQEYRFEIPAKALVRGANYIQIQARYASTRKHRSIAVGEVRIEGLDKPATPKTLTTGPG